MLSQLLCMFYLRSDSLDAQCASESAVFVVDAQGTTCGQVFASSETSSAVTTGGLALINVGFLVFMAVFTLRVWVLENALMTAPTSLVGRGLHRANKRLLATLTGRGSRDGADSSRQRAASTTRAAATSTSNPMLHVAGAGSGVAPVRVAGAGTGMAPVRAQFSRRQVHAAQAPPRPLSATSRDDEDEVWDEY